MKEFAAQTRSSRFALRAIVATAAVSVLFVLAIGQAEARGGRGGGGGGGRGGGVSRPSGGFSRPSGGYSRPSGGYTRPSGGYTRPSGGGPSNRPSGGYGTRPGGGGEGTRWTPDRDRINTGRNDINIDHNTNIDVDNGWHGWDDDWGSFAAGAVVGGVTGAAIAGSYAPGTVIYTLPPSCSTVIVNGVMYQNCGGTYFVPSYQGASVAYEAVPSPY